MGLLLPGAAAAKPPAGPRCIPATLDNSALAGAVRLSPLPGSRDASPRTQISFLGVPATALRAVRVVGSRSGAHPGRLAPYSQGDGASFLPQRPFEEGERVTVRARVRAGGRGAAGALLDQFVIAHDDALTYAPERTHPGAQVQSFRSRPELHPPAVTVTASSPQAAPGEELLAPYGGPGQAGPMILDPSGRLVWFKPLPTGTSAANLQVQRLHGRPVLTWWQGEISQHGFGRGEDIVDDTSYSTIARVLAGNGLTADLHDFQLTPRGTALITAYHPILCDLSAVGGPAQGAVTDGVMQEVDLATGLVRYEWTSLDHVGLDESYEHASNSSTGWPFDFFHINSLSLDQDGSILISARNTWTVYAIDGRSGQVSWRLGGRRSSFSAGPGTATAWQHDPQQLPDGAISIFDNGSSPTVHRQSRGIVLVLDPQHRAATLLAQFTHAPPLVSESQGSMQLLQNGDWFLGWGQEPALSEYAPQGTLLFEAQLPAHEQSYRAFRFEWQATPAHLPTFAVVNGPSGATVYASWNGATQLAAWRVLAGATPATLAPLAQAASEGFETAIALPPGAGAQAIAVQALDAAGRVLATSTPAPAPGPSAAHAARARRTRPLSGGRDPRAGARAAARCAARTPPSRC